MVWNEPPFVLLEDNASPAKRKTALVFTKPQRVLETRSLRSIPSLVLEMESLQAQGKHLAGWLAYEAGYAFHPTLVTRCRRISKEPLAWIGVFDAPHSLSRAELETALTSTNAGDHALHLKPDESRQTFGRVFRTIKNHIARGDVYQINHTFRLTGRCTDSPLHWYGALRQAQPVPYGAYINTGRWCVLSFSPELFLKRRGHRLISRPMKGTAPCGNTLEEMETNSHALSSDIKNRAENLMITDLLRNDIARVARAGSVKVSRPFHVEKFGRVLQMTTDVEGRLKRAVGFADIFKALFPSGSITGAPKARAMEIIAHTELSARGIYTGALGHWSPGGDFTLSIPIRTLTLAADGRATFGVGSGIVADSTHKNEYEECLLKTQFLSERPRSFALIETLLWSRRGGFVFLNEHLERMSSSARFFGFVFDRSKAQAALQRALRRTLPTQHRRIRLLCDRHGRFAIDQSPFTPPQGEKQVVFARSKVSSQDLFLHHKTTERGAYEKAWRSIDSGTKKPYDILLLNERGEVTEGTYNNVFVTLPSGKLATPPLQCGLLSGVLRRHLLESGKAVERVVRKQDLAQAKRFYIGNSLTGLVTSKL